MAAYDKANILIVDDLPEKLLVLQSILEPLGQNIIQAATGQEALRQVLEREFAVILLDVNMPDMDGFETAELIRWRKKSAHTPIIFITAYADELFTARGYSLGAVDYILSPVVPDILRTKVKVFVDLFRMSQQVKFQAEERVALAQEQAAREAAELATQRSSFLADASSVLARSLDPETTLRNLAVAAVPFLADLSLVLRLDEQGEPACAEAAWRSEDGQTAQATVPREFIAAELLDAVWRAVASGTPEVLTHLGVWNPARSEVNGAGNGVALPAFVGQSALVLPIVLHGRNLGILVLARGPHARRYRDADVDLAKDLTDRAAMALDNARLYQNIRDEDQRKNEFLAMLAHELRNPLAPIRNAAQALRLSGLVDATLIQARDVIDRQVRHMARLIDDLLDMSRLSHGKILLRKEPVDLTELVKAAVNDFRSLTEEAGQRLELQAPSEPLHVHGDPIRLTQVLGNVLNNATKFSPMGGRISVRVSAEPAGDAAVVTVRDTGIGMEPETLRRAFDTFSQADRSLDRSRGGLGLGLALVRGLVELHGGEVRAASDGLGRGTEVAIRLPLERSPVPARSRPAKPPAITRPLRVLVIEDNRDAAQSMRLLLTLSGHQAEVALTGAAGIELADMFRPDVVLCDIGLAGGMDGYAVARSLRQKPDVQSAYLVAVTGYGQEEDQRRCREAGFDAHVIKPVDYDQLEWLLASLPQPALQRS